MLHKPPLVCIKDYEDYAAHWLQKMVYDYYRSGADEEHTLAENTRAFKRYLIMPRVLRDVSQRDISTIILGHKISFPVCVAPTAMQRMAHPEGEVATAKAAAKLGTAFTLSTIATSSIEEIAAGASDGLRFMQVYIYKDRQVTESLVRRAEQAGFKALLLTVDTPFFGKRRADNKNRFKLAAHLKMANFLDADIKTYGVGQSRKESGLNEYAQSLFDPTLTWDDVKWLQSISKLPVVLKGILREDDAKKAVEIGVAGILVSNHGARQLDTVPATIDVLPRIVRAVEGRCEVYLDGGIRGGTDILKALALGARAVFVGRPTIYGLAYDGENGVQQVLEILRDEFSSAMALSGCRTVEEISPNLVIHKTALARL